MKSVYKNNTASNSIFNRMFKVLRFAHTEDVTYNYTVFIITLILWEQWSPHHSYKNDDTIV